MSTAEVDCQHCGQHVRAPLKARHHVLAGDSRNTEDVARLMGDERADAVFTSPPYGVGIDYGEGGYEDTIANLRAMLPALAVVWRDLVVAGGGVRGDQLQ